MTKMGLFVIVLYLYTIVAWLVNLVKLLNCDFSGPIWKEEVVHIIGLIPGVSMITCWY